MSRKTFERIERLIIALMLLGMVGMFQPLSVDLYRYGFLVLLGGTLSYIIFSRFSPRTEPSDATGPVSVSKIVEPQLTHDHAG